MVRGIHTEEFKREAVKLALTSGLPRRAIADDLGIGKSTLSKWISQYRQETHPAEGVGLQKELVRLQRENKVLREERDLLLVPFRVKKATAFFASQKS